MKKLLYPFLFLIFLQYFVSAQSWEYCTNSKVTITAMATDSLNIYITTSGNGILFSSDNGQSWEKRNNGIDDLELTAISTMGNIIFAGTRKGDLYMSENQAALWRKIINIEHLDTNMTYIETSNNHIFVCYNNKIISSDDTCKTWKTLLSNSELHYINSLSFNNNNLCAVGPFGIYYSLNAGYTWVHVDFSKIYLPEIFSVLIDGHCIYTGAREGVILSSDLGQNWLYTDLNFTFMILKFKKILFTATMNGIIVFTDSLMRNGYFLNTGLDSSQNSQKLCLNRKYLILGCKTNIYRLPLNVFNSPDINISGKTIVCRGDTCVYATTYQSYMTTTWRVEGGALVGTPTDSNVTVLWDSLGKGRVILNKQSKIFENDNIDSSAFDITINEVPPKPKIRQSNDTLFSDSPQGNQWYRNGILIPGAVGQLYTLADSGYYTVQVTLIGCESEMSDILFVDKLSVNDNSGFTNLVVLSPNPAGDYITVTVESNGCSPESMKIFDVFGQEYLTPTLSTSGEGVRIDVSEMTPGVYFVRVGEKVSKFVKI